MQETRANCSVVIPGNQTDYIYAFAGYNNMNMGSAVTSSIERLKISPKPGASWKLITLTMSTEAKACNYMYEVDNETILVFGGWQNGQTSKVIDVFNYKN